VVKHGNYGVSSVSGSSDVMEYLGYTFTNDTSVLQKQLDKNNICLLHAPLFHPALKQVASVRRQLGIKTFFNMLGPLVNPSNPTHHYTGTYNLPLARLYNYLFQQDESQYVVVHSLDGYDEISLTGACKWYGSGGEFIFNPDDWNLTVLNQESLFGGNTIKEAATIFVRVIEGKGTEAQTNAVIANAAAALYCLHPENTIQHHLDIARETLESGKAFQTFKNTIG
jgi:anthranilate phosphoribosyltransferase